MNKILSYIYLHMKKIKMGQMIVANSDHGSAECEQIVFTPEANNSQCVITTIDESGASPM